MRKIILLLSILFLFLSCTLINGNPPVADEPIENIDQRASKDKWVFLIYMAADNNLESEAIEDIWEMETSCLNTKNSTVLILLDRNPSYDISNNNWNGTKMFKLKTGRSSTSKAMISEEIDCPELGLKTGRDQELDMSDTYVLSNAISFMMNKFKADHYGLIMWGHGTGWRDSDTLSVKSSKAFAYDATTGTYMSLSHLKKAIENGLQSKKLDIIGFDTCFGGEIENLYELRNTANYIIGTPGLLVSAGWNYNTLFNDFSQKDEHTPDAFCESAIYQYSKEYIHKQNSSISTFDLSQIDQFINSFEEIMEESSKQINNPQIRDDISNDIFSNGILYTEGIPGSDVYIDLESLISIISKHIDISDFLQPFFDSLNKFIHEGWSSESENPSPGIYFASIAESGLFAAKHPSGYTKGATTEQIDFVSNNNWYVPTKNKTGSFIDKLFYTANW